MDRLAVVGIVVEGDRTVAIEVQRILSEYGHIIIGRMGIPDRENDISVISVIARGSNEEISALSGKLGRLPNVSVKSAMTNRIIEK